jgi:hypothetical protein
MAVHCGLENAPEKAAVCLRDSEEPSLIHFRPLLLWALQRMVNEITDCQVRGCSYLVLHLECFFENLSCKALLPQCLYWISCSPSEAHTPFVSFGP